MKALLLLLTLMSAAHAQISVDDLNKLIDATNVQVNEGCSGTVIDAQERLVLTNNHCVAAQYEVIEREKIDEEGVITKEKVRRLRDGTVTKLLFSGPESVTAITYKVRLKAVDKERDLALMQIIAAVDAIAAPLACHEPKRGEPIYIVGNPMGSLYSSVATGVVSSIQRTYHMLNFGGSEQQKRPLMQVSGGIVGGNSGGAVFNTDGELVGVPTLAHRVNEVLGFAVPLTEIKAFLAFNGLERLSAHCAQ